MTHMTIGSVWQTDVSGKWSVPSLQGNQYVIGFMERTSRKLFLYFSKNKDVYAQTKDLIEAEIPKLRARHSLRDFIIHSDVGEFQSDKIRSMVRSYGGEIQKGSAYTPEHQCFIERAWRTIKEMASTMIIAAGLSEQYWECAQMYAMLIHNRTVRPTEVPGEMKSPDDIYYDVPHDMQQFEPFGCKAYVYIAKEVRRKNHKGRAELASFVGFEDNTVPGYKFYVHKLHDVFHSHARRLEAFVKNGVVAWPFDPKKVKPVNFKKCLMPCDACGLAKTTRVTFRGKVMTHMTIGSVWQTDVSGKWSVPSLQGNQYVIGFMERTSRKLFLYFSKNKDVYAQTKDLIEAEIPKLRARHSLRDFIIHSDVGEFQSDKIRSMVRSYGGEIQKGSAYTPEHQCFIERAWRTIKEMASTMIIAAGLSEQYWECAQMYAMLIHNRTVRPTEVPGEMKSPDDIYYDVPHDMQQFEPFGCKAYVYIAKEVRRKNHKGRAELAIFVGFEDNTVPG